MVDLILASGSPRRRELLTRAGIGIECDPPDCDEEWHPGEPATDYAARVARQKAQRVLQLRAGQALDSRTSPPWVLAADTTVWIPEHKIPVGKPQDRSAARQGLKSLFAAGSHRVSTAFCIFDARSQTLVAQEVVSTQVWMRTPSPAELELYLDTGEWEDKAGGYGIQGAAAGFVTRLEGSYTNVVGLPLAEVLEVLATLKGQRKAREDQVKA